MHFHFEPQEQEEALAEKIMVSSMSRIKHDISAAWVSELRCRALMDVCDWKRTAERGTTVEGIRNDCRKY